MSSIRPREQRITTQGITLTAIRIVGGRVWWHRYEGIYRRRGWVLKEAWLKMRLKEPT